MHHTAHKVIRQLNAGTGRLTLTLDKGDSAWNPASTSGRPIHGPAKVSYMLHRDGGVDCQVTS